MLRHGYVERADLPEDLSVEAMPTPAIAYTMFEQFGEDLDERDEAAIEIICNTMHTGRDLIHARRSFVRRYDAVNDALMQVMEGIFQKDQKLRVHDVAVSNGVTSREMFEALTGTYDVSLHATDYLDKIWIVDGAAGWQVIFDADGRPLQFVRGSMVLTAQGREPRQFPLNRLIATALKLTVLPGARRRLAALRDDASGIRSIGIFHPRAQGLAEKDERFTLGQADMYVPVDGPFDIVRVMSAFTDVDDDQLRRAVDALCAPLVDGGLFIVGRNRGRHTSEIPTTIFRRQGDRLVVMRDLMGGAEERDRILGFRLAS